MRRALALTAASAAAAIAAAFAGSAYAYERRPDIPPEIGIGAPIDGFALIPYRCSDRVRNFYHGALYAEPPAVHLGYAYRPYYRYTANRVIPRTHFCSSGPRR